MINLCVDESYAFDYLSILFIKHKADIENLKKRKNYENCLDFLKAQFPDDSVFYNILNSVEYENCQKANQTTFDAVDKAKNDSIPASYVDQCNYKRHTAKQALQKKFFPSDLTEIKIGYEIYEKKDL
jgi:hypothetical protein